MTRQEFDDLLERLAHALDGLPRQRREPVNQFMLVLLGAFRKAHAESAYWREMARQLEQRLGEVADAVTADPVLLAKKHDTGGNWGRLPPEWGGRGEE